MGTVEKNNIVDLAAYRQYREERRKTWRPLCCPVCGAPATDTLDAWVYSYGIGQFVCGEFCYQKVEETYDTDC